MGFDFGKKEVIVSQPVYPTENIDDDLEKILVFYRTIRGRNPELGIA